LVASRTADGRLYDLLNPLPAPGSAGRIGAVFAKEQAHLRPFAQPFDGYFEQPCRVSSTCTVAYDRPGSPADPLVWIRRLIEAEQVERQVRSLRYQLRAARFPIHREPDHFRWDEADVDRALIKALASAELTQEAHNLILVGGTGTGTGKTHLAIALGVGAIRRGKRVRFNNVVDLVNRLEQ
jgi:DNA replication protein DnaC